MYANKSSAYLSGREQRWYKPRRRLVVKKLWARDARVCPRGTFRFRTFTYFLTKKMDNTSWAIKDTYQRLWSNDDIFQLLANDIKNGHKLTWDSKIYWRKGSCLKFCSFYLLEERIQGLVKYLPGEGIASRNSPPSI